METKEEDKDARMSGGVMHESVCCYMVRAPKEADMNQEL